MVGPVSSSQGLSPEDSQSWQRLRGRLKAEVGDAAFNSWLRQLDLTRGRDGRMMMTLPTRFMRDCVVSHYAEKIRSLWNDEFDTTAAAEIHVRPAGPRVSEPAPEAAKGAEAGRSTPAGPMSALSDPGAPLDPRFTFENFVVGKTNELAYAASRRAAESPTVPFNPLFLYGGVGLGKTHLMHAIAWHIRERDPDRKVIYLSAEKFMYQFIRALRFKYVMQFKQLFRSVDVLMIDDVQFNSGKESTQD